MIYRNWLYVKGSICLLKAFESDLKTLGRIPNPDSADLFRTKSKEGCILINRGVTFRWNYYVFDSIVNMGELGDVAHLYKILHLPEDRAIAIQLSSETEPIPKYIRKIETQEIFEVNQRLFSKFFPGFYAVGKEGYCIAEKDAEPIKIEQHIKTTEMKFKNWLYVEGPSSLLQAFEKEIIKVGHIPNTNSRNLEGFDHSPCYMIVNCTAYPTWSYWIHDGKLETKSELEGVYHWLYLPKDWNYALKLAAEKEKESKLEVGKWYKTKKGALAFYRKRGDNYGFGNDGIWSDTVWMLAPGKWREATKEEIEAALKAEAERRGFKKGACYNSVKGTSFPHHRDGEYIGSGITFDPLNNGLVSGYGVIFYNGKWAEIIEDKLTVAGYEVHKLPGRGDVAIRIGCTTLEKPCLEGLQDFIDIVEDHGQLEIIYEGKRIKDDLKKVFEKYKI